MYDYELLNIRNKFKGKRLYYCSFDGDSYYSFNIPILRRVYIRMATNVGDNLVIVGEQFRLEIPLRNLVANRKFSMVMGNKIISTEKQEVARFIKLFYFSRDWRYYDKKLDTSLRNLWNKNDYSVRTQCSKYKQMIEQLKKL